VIVWRTSFQCAIFQCERFFAMALLFSYGTLQQKRIFALLASGKQAWVYADARLS
jgi:hypothetical protein